MIGRTFRALGSLRLTVALLACSMFLIFFATIDQVNWGIAKVQAEYFESFFCAYPLGSESAFRLPMPGGFLIGGFLLANLTAAHFRHFRPGWARCGVTVTHAGVLVLIVSGFSTAALQKESMTVIAQGGSANWSSSFSEPELALADTSGAGENTVTVIPEALLRDLSTKGVFPVPGSPLEIRVKRYYPNAPVVPPVMADSFPGLTPIRADNGTAARTNVRILPGPESFAQNARNSPGALVEVLDAGKSLGTWFVNADLDGVAGPQPFTAAGRTHEISMRMKRTYLPFSLRLEKFTHDKYPGTEIPKNFASEITLSDPREKAPRSVVISMNQPLRHDGFTFYQASFSSENGVTSTALQTVQNASYMLPYVAVSLIGLGLCLQFGLSLARFIGASQKQLKGTPKHD